VRRSAACTGIRATGSLWFCPRMIRTFLSNSANIRVRALKLGLLLEVIKRGIESRTKTDKPLTASGRNQGRKFC
jgi:hypothetical protein